MKMQIDVFHTLLPI